MPKSEIIQTRISPELKSSAQNVLKELNISMSEAITMFLTQVTLHKGIPFDVKIPNELTAQTLKSSEEGKRLHRASDVDALFEDLED